MTEKDLLIQDLRAENERLKRENECLNRYIERELNKQSDEIAKEIEKLLEK